MIEFVFMLTHNDATVADARDVLLEVKGSGLRYIGFKDVGAPTAALRELAEMAHEAEMEVMLEIVSTSRDDELQSLSAAAEIGVDWVLGGTHPKVGVEVLHGTGISYYCPFPGIVEGHPSVLRGTVSEIVEHARELTSSDAVHGVDLLAYRHPTADPLQLVRAVVEAVDARVIVAGSVSTLGQVADLDRVGAWGFTIGGAIFERLLPGGDSFAGQVQAVLAAANGTAGIR